MSDSSEDFESELSRLRPKSPSAGLAGRIAAELDVPSRPSFADRCLVAFIGTGAVAASVIVTLIGWQVMEDNRGSAVADAAAGRRPAIATQHRGVSAGFGAFGRGDA